MLSGVAQLLDSTSGARTGSDLYGMHSGELRTAQHSRQTRHGLTAGARFDPVIPALAGKDGNGHRCRDHEPRSVSCQLKIGRTEGVALGTGPGRHFVICWARFLGKPPRTAPDSASSKRVINSPILARASVSSRSSRSLRVLSPRVPCSRKMRFQLGPARGSRARPRRALRPAGAGEPTQTSAERSIIRGAPARSMYWTAPVVPPASRLRPHARPPWSRSS